MTSIETQRYVAACLGFNKAGTNEGNRLRLLEAALKAHDATCASSSSDTVAAGALFSAGKDLIESSLNDSSRPSSRRARWEVPSVRCTSSRTQRCTLQRLGVNRSACLSSTTLIGIRLGAASMKSLLVGRLPWQPSALLAPRTGVAH